MDESDLAREMAAAVLAGDAAAAYALADLLLECRASGKDLSQKAADSVDAIAYVEKAEDAARRASLVAKWRLRDVERRGAEVRIALRALLAKASPAVRMASRLRLLWRVWEPYLDAQTGIVLERLGCVTPREVSQKGRAFVEAAEGCGVETMKRIEGMLARYGLSWR